MKSFLLFDRGGFIKNNLQLSKLLFTLNNERDTPNLVVDLHCIQKNSTAELYDHYSSLIIDYA